MARVNYNVVTHGVSGKIGDLLQFRQRNGKTIIAKIAARSGKVAPAQQQVRDKFRQAAAYARSVIKNPAIREIYESRASGGITPYNLALKDFFTSPVISGVDLAAYIGDTGNPITITATDDTKVVEVKVQIVESNGNILEEGLASQQGEQDAWVYTASAFNNNPSGSRVVVQVRDLPGNTTTREFVL
jgi:hypothetical protein